MALAAAGVLALASCGQAAGGPATRLQPVGGWYSMPRADVDDVLAFEPAGEKVLVTDRMTGLVVAVPASDVRLTEDRLEFKVNPSVELAQPPRDPSPRLAGAATKAKVSCNPIVGCSHLTYCLGFVQICCAVPHKVVGACIGAWDCGCD
jgi:hypothetical protein